MTNTYKALSEYGKAIFGEDVFNADFTASEEKDHLDGGHLEIVPRDYEVTSDNFSGGPKGAHYRAALLKEVEAALIAGYHIRRMGDDEPPEPATAPDQDSTDSEQSTEESTEPVETAETTDEADAPDL